MPHEKEKNMKEKYENVSGGVKILDIHGNIVVDRQTTNTKMVIENGVDSDVKIKYDR